MHCHYINGTQNANLFNLARIELLLFAPAPSVCTYVLGKLDRFIVFFLFCLFAFFLLCGRCHPMFRKLGN